MKYIGKWMRLLVIVMTMLFAPGCSGSELATASVDVNISDAQKLWQNKEAIIIDVRTPEEYREGHVPGALLIPLSELGNRIGEVPKDKKVLIICRSGNRSAQATKFLRDKGFTNVFNITGGMNEWRGPVEK